MATDFECSDVVGAISQKHAANNWEILIVFVLFAITVLGATLCANEQKDVDVKTLFDLLPSDRSK